MAPPLQTIAQGVDFIWTPLCDQYGNPITSSNPSLLGSAGVTGFTPFDAFPVRDIALKGQLASGAISSFSVGSNIIVLTAPPTGLYPNSIFVIAANPNQYEFLITDSTYVAGSATVKTTTPVKNTITYTNALWENPDGGSHVGGPRQNKLSGWGGFPTVPLAYDILNDGYRILQCDPFGNLFSAPKPAAWIGNANLTLTNVASWAGFDHSTAIQYSQFIVDINLTAISVGTITFFISRLDANGVAYQLATTAALSAPTKQAWTIGAGLQINQFPQADLRVDATFAGGASCSFTMDMYSR